ILVEEGKLRLDDPVSKYIPEFADAKVLVVPEEKGAEPKTVPARREVTVRDLLTHTAGLTYRFFNRPHFGKLYADAGVSDGLVETPGTIADNARKLAKLPLVHHPGEGWEYGLNTDVLGRVIEVASGKTLDAFFRERIFEPLKMNDTHFVLPEEKRSRLAAVYTPGKDKTLRRVGKEPVREGELIYSATYPTWGESRYYSGGAGLVSTVGDYHRFLLMLLNGGELDGARVLKPETVREMTRNQIAELSVPFNAHGTGFGYGFGVVTDREKAKEVASEGTYSWGGFFYTYFWVDPKRELIGILMTQTYPNGHLKLRERFKELTYEALKAAPQ
ncbi:MAG TPA: serine hydrolase, partial [Gemmataceae bacterium]